MTIQTFNKHPCCFLQSWNHSWKQGKASEFCTPGCFSFTWKHKGMVWSWGGLLWEKGTLCLEQGKPASCTALLGLLMVTWELHPNHRPVAQKSLPSTQFHSVLPRTRSWSCPTQPPLWPDPSTIRMSFPRVEFWELNFETWKLLEHFWC